MFRFRFPKRDIQTLLVAGGIERLYRETTSLCVAEMECLTTQHVALATENVHSPSFAVVLDMLSPIGKGGSAIM